VEREPEQPLLAAVDDVAADVEQHPSLAAANAEHAARLLDDVDRARVTRRVRQEHRRLEPPPEDRLAKLSVRGLGGARNRDQSKRRDGRKHPERHGAKVADAR
jgi:hypothetical protein